MEHNVYYYVINDRKHNTIKSVNEELASPNCHESSAEDLGKSDVDLRQLLFQFPIAAATEIEASLESHAPIKYKMIPIQVSVTDYFKIPPMIGIDDPRLRRNVTAAGDPMFTQSVSVAVNTTVRPVIPQKIAPRDPRRPQQDISMSISAIHAPLLPTPNPLVQKHPMYSNPPVLCPQMMAAPNDPRRKLMVPRDPKQMHRFDVDERINYMNYF